MRVAAVSSAGAEGRQPPAATAAGITRITYSATHRIQALEFFSETRSASMHPSPAGPVAALPARDGFQQPQQRSARELSRLYNQYRPPTGGIYFKRSIAKRSFPTFPPKNGRIRHGLAGIQAGPGSQQAPCCGCAYSGTSQPAGQQIGRFVFRSQNIENNDITGPACPWISHHSRQRAYH
jgi:hypothetical protein